MELEYLVSSFACSPIVYPKTIVIPFSRTAAVISTKDLPLIMSAHWYFGTTHGSGVSVESFGGRTVITLPNHLTIVASGSVSFTSTPNRNSPSPRGPAHAYPEYRRRGQQRREGSRGRPWPGHGRGRGRRERYGGVGRHDGQQRGEPRTNAPRLEDGVILPGSHSNAHAITNLSSTNQHAVSDGNPITTDHDHHATYPNRNADMVTAGQDDTVAYENTNANGMAIGHYATPISKATGAGRAQAATTSGLLYDAMHMAYQRSEAGDTLMSWDEASVNETTVGNYQAMEQDDEYHLLSPNSYSEMTTTITRSPIPDLVTSNDPGLVNGLADEDPEVVGR
ncbi:hypothetical protein BDW75DRAFT_148729 [Aspergillus navahoensis]